MRRFALALGLVLSSSIPDAQAQPRPAGPPMIIESGEARTVSYGPQVARGAEGSFVVAWTRWSIQPQSQSDIVFRKFKMNGEPLGRRFRVNQFLPEFQLYVDAAMNEQGEIAFTWNSEKQDGDMLGAYARLYRGRVPVSEETPVPVHTDGSQQFPRVGIDEAGRFTVVWESTGQDSGGSFDAWARRFDEDGQPLADPFRLNVYRDNAQSNPDIAMSPDGSSVVVWRSWNQAGPGAGIYGRRFDADGEPLGGEFRIHQSTIPSAGTPAVTRGPDGGFLVAWDRCDFSNPAAGCAVLARRYDASGKAAGREFLVSTKDTRTHEHPAAAFDSRGNFAITWNLCDTHPSGQPFNCRIAVRFYDREGKAFEDLQVIESDNMLMSPAIIGFKDQFLVAWHTITCDVDSCGRSPEGVFVQRYVLRTKR